MKFEEFVEKVERWSLVRKIYENSTEAQQQAKILKKVGEYIVRLDRNSREKSLGLISVGIVNAAHLFNSGRLTVTLGGYWYLGDVISPALKQNYDCSISRLAQFAQDNGYDFNECLKSAWMSIADIRGLFIDGRLVRWDELKLGDRWEFMERESKFLN